LKPRRQVAALPYRHQACGLMEVCLVTTRQTRRWVIPKGWPKERMAHWNAAAEEAFEEAGVRGKIERECFGSYLYWKRMRDHFVLIDTQVYLLEVTEELIAWPEMTARQRHWAGIAEATEEVLEPGLISLLLALEGRSRKIGTASSRSASAPTRSQSFPS